MFSTFPLWDTRNFSETTQGELKGWAPIRIAEPAPVVQRCGEPGRTVKMSGKARRPAEHRIKLPLCEYCRERSEESQRSLQCKTGTVERSIEVCLVTETPRNALRQVKIRLGGKEILSYGKRIYSSSNVTLTDYCPVHHPSILGLVHKKEDQTEERRGRYQEEESTSSAAMRRARVQEYETSLDGSPFPEEPSRPSLVISRLQPLLDGSRTIHCTMRRTALLRC
ncbi:hypothetical protein RUM43_014100 [Polyplax serrata]|uniref:Uncharacterized protein n=1 Tax=Polyplax serrata TaxID=468196 RepID=A0AAN8PBL5_POLSC